MKKSLAPLAAGGFGIGMTEFVMMGILPDIATSISITIPQAGYLISAYALGVVVGAPTLVALMSRRAPKQVLVWLMVLFAVTNAVSALAPGFGLLLLCRFLSGLPHGAFFGVGAVVASRLADKGKVATAVGSMFTGVTIANIVGVPVATWLGHNVSWRAVFVAVGIIGIATVLLIRRWIPDVAAAPGAGVREDLKIFRRPGLWLAVAITAIGTGGFFSSFSYIAPLLTTVARFHPSAIPLIMSVAGIGMLAGVHLGARLADRVAPIKAVAILLTSMTILLILDGWCAPSKPAILVLLFATGANALALGAPIQLLLIDHARGAEMMGSSLGQSGFNVGNALGAFLGGIPLTLGYTYASPQWVGAGLALAGMLLALLMLRRHRTFSTMVHVTPVR